MCYLSGQWIMFAIHWFMDGATAAQVHGTIHFLLYHNPIHFCWIRWKYSLSSNSGMLLHSQGKSGSSIHGMLYYLLYWLTLVCKTNGI